MTNDDPDDWDSSAQTRRSIDGSKSSFVRAALRPDDPPTGKIRLGAQISTKKFLQKCADFTFWAVPSGAIFASAAWTAKSKYRLNNGSIGLSGRESIPSRAFHAKKENPGHWPGFEFSPQITRRTPSGSCRGTRHLL